MNMEMNITEKFELSDGITILACEGYDPDFDVIGKNFHLIFCGEVRQTLKISGERILLNQKANLGQRAFEIRDIVLLSPEEARSGNWQLSAV